MVQQRYQDWLEAQQTVGKTFTAEQRWWLDEIARHVGVNGVIGLEDLGNGRFHDEGGIVRARRLLGDLQPIVKDLNKALGAS